MKTNQLFGTFLTGMLLSLTPQTVSAADTVTLAQWTFEDETDATVWFANGALSLSPDDCVGEKSAYVMTGLSTGRYWQTCAGYNNRVLRIENTGNANDINDYTDASQHDAFYEAKFPTKGYENIAVSFAIAAGNNTAVPMEVVVSTDGGSTWFDGGTYTTANTWWTYNPATFNLSAKDKDDVRVRIIVGNGQESNWNMDFFKIEGTAVEAAQPVEAKNATISWAFKDGANNAVPGILSVEGATSATSFTLGDNLYINGAQAANSGVTLSKLNPYEAVAKSRDEKTYVKFTVVPKRGISFAPKSLSLNAAKFGTSGGTFDVVAVKGEQTIEVAKAQNPARNNVDPFHTSYTWDLSSLADNGERLDLYFYVYNLAANKQLGLSDVVLTGDFVGTPEVVPAYTFAVKLGTLGAGNVSVNPSGAEFDEDTELTVKATENFGYHFASWNDEAGNVISTENPYTFNIKANTVLVANYNKSNVYALNLDLQGGANTNGVLFSPEGNLIEGVHYYEEGTDVVISAQDNRILTFTHWEDNSTDANRSIKMDGEKNVTANFSCADYIVGWDLWFNEPRSERAADYKANSENAGLLSLHNAEGQTSSWLPNGVETGKTNGRYGARVWKKHTEGYYFEITFATKEYSNITLVAALGNDYNSCAKIDAQYSIDGTNYTTIHTYEMPNRGWADADIAMPADAAGQEKVWVRFVGRDWSQIAGVESDNDGTTIGGIFVLADSDTPDDPIPPVLVNSIPANGAEGASATGSIILTFDEKVKAGVADGAATLAGETIVPTISGKNVVYPYIGLKYGTEYELVLPAGAITDRNNNAFAGTTIRFTTMQRTQPEAKLYDAIVAQDGTGDYETVQAAIDAAPAGRATPWLIFVKAGKYKEHIDIPASKPYIHLIGQDRNTVEIYDDRLCGGDNAVHVSVGATVVVWSNNCFFEGINFVNSYGRDTNNGPQALAMNTIGDRIVFNKVGMISYQDTWITTSTSNNRHFCKDSWIEGAVDFIYNSGNVYFDRDTINIVRKSGGYIVAPSHGADVKWGYVFMNNLITAKGVTGVETQPAELQCKPSDVSVWLGRPWHNFPKTVFLNTKMEVTIPATGWYETMGGLPALWADYGSVDGNGNPIDLSNRRDTYYYVDANGEKVYGTAKNRLTDAEAAEYTVKNVMSGEDGWQPELLCEACHAPVVTASDDVLSWEAVPYAICYVITKGQETIGFTKDCHYTVEGNVRDYKVQAANEFGGLSAYAPVKTITGVIEVIETSADETKPLYNIAGQRVSKDYKGFVISKGGVKRMN